MSQQAAAVMLRRSVGRSICHRTKSSVGRSFSSATKAAQQPSGRVALAGIGLGGLGFAAAAVTAGWIGGGGVEAVVVAEGVGICPSDPPSSKCNTLQGGMKEAIVAQYENRIRAFSNPEKIFLYFASVTKDGEKLMNAEDFIRSITSGSSLPAGERKGEQKMSAAATRTGKRLFQMVDMNSDGLVSFHEYIFCTTIMAIPEGKFKVVFDMFDLDGNSELDQEEFCKLMEVFRTKSRVGAAARSGVVSASNAVRRNKEATLQVGEYPVLFGPMGDKKLSFSRFLVFLRSLQDDVLRLEFESFGPDRSDTISSQEFASAVISNAFPKDFKQLQSRIDREDFPETRVEWSEFVNFHRVLRSLNDVHYALETFSSTESVGKIDRPQLLRAIKAASGVKLNDETVNIIFSLFDKKATGTVDQQALFSTLTLRKTRGMVKRREVDPFAFFGCAQSCFSHYVLMGGRN